MTSTQQRLRLVLEYAERERLNAEAAAVARDPRAHRLTTVFDKPLTYTYWAVRGARTRTYWCASNHKNVAGYFLIWRQRHYRDGRVVRDKWDATTYKRIARDTARRLAE